MKTLIRLTLAAIFILSFILCLKYFDLEKEANDGVVVLKKEKQIELELLGNLIRIEIARE